MLFRDVRPFIRYARRQAFSPVPVFRKSYDCRFYYVLSGSVDMVADGQTHPMKHGSCAVVPSCVRYQFLNARNLEIYAVNFDYTFEFDNHPEAFHPVPEEQFQKEKAISAPCLDDVPAFQRPLVLPDLQALEPLLCQICLEMETQRIYYRERMSGQFQMVLTDLLRRSQGHTSTTADVIDRLISHIQTHLCEELSARSISEIFGYHENHINRLMRKSTGVTLHQYILSQRINRAKALLLDTELSIEQISEQTGWEHSCNFSTQFKRSTGISPSEFRLRHKHNT